MKNRVDGFLDRMKLCLALTGLLVGLSIVVSVMTHQHIVGPLERLETVALAVRRTKDYSLRIEYTSRSEIGQLASAALTGPEEYLQSGRLQETWCLITDVHMSGMTGIELQERLAKDGHMTKVIVITGFPDEALRRRAPKAGAFGFATLNACCAHAWREQDTLALYRCIGSPTLSITPTYQRTMEPRAIGSKL